MTTPGGQLTPGDETTPPVYGVPDGAYVGDAGSPNAISQLSHMTESSAKDAMKTPVAPSFAAQRDGQWGLVQDMIDMMNNRYTGTTPTFIDGQLDLTDRFDLLGTSAYCAAYMGPNLVLGPGRNRALPFDSQIGPPQDAEIVQVVRTHPGVSGVQNEWCIRLDRAGLWEAQVHISHYNSLTFPANADNYRYAWVEIVVLSPTYEVWSVTRCYSGRPNPGRNATDVVFPKRFVVPAPGYFVQARFMYSIDIATRTVVGGAARSSFSAIQWSDELEDTSNEDPDGEIIDGDEDEGDDEDIEPLGLIVDPQATIWRNQ